VDEQDFDVNTIGEDGKPTGQVEIIGWLYQYYNTELKDDTFAKLKKNVKITKERIPAATQLFTPDWIVRYMVENSVGRIWIEHLRALDADVDEKQTAEKFGWKYYLPEAEQEETVNLQLAEIRKDYKDLQPTDIKCIDPCMGSGHILIAMFDVLMDIYKSAGYSERDAAFEIVEHNIYGLDIDKRAYQLAYFAVMMKGRGYNRKFLQGKDNVKMIPKIYAIMESNEIEKNHLQFFGKSLDDSERNKAVKQMEYLLHTFVDAREYGSILNVEECDWELQEKFVDDLDVSGQYSFESVGCEETQEKLRELVQIAKLLGQKYEAVVTNPPYMGASNMNSTLSAFIKDNYADYKSDFFSAFIIRCSSMVKTQGYLGFLTPYVWMFIQSYEKLRTYLYTQATIEKLIQFEYSAFEEATVPICTFVFRNSYVNKKGCYVRLTDFRGGMEVQRQKTLEAIENCSCGYYFEQNSDDFTKIPGSPVAYWLGERIYRFYKQEKALGDIISSQVGSTLGDNNSFLRCWYEVSATNKGKWFYSHKGGAFRRWYGNVSHVVNWENNGFAVKNAGRATIRGEKSAFLDGISWTQLTAGKPSFRIKYAGTFIESASCMCRIDNEFNLYLLGMLNSKVAEIILCAMNPTMHFQPGDIGRMPWMVDEKRKSSVDSIVCENINCSKEDWDSFETSWDFQHHPLIPTQQMKSAWQESQFADSRMEKLGSLQWNYERWENECNDRFNQLKANEEELNRIFIDIYGLQDELTPEVEDKDVTVRKANLGRDIRSFISYAVGCMFGRYSLAKEGLMFAGGQMTDIYQYHSGTLDGSFTLDGKFPMDGQSYYYLEGDDYLIDGDNIIPITDEEYFSDDIVGRFVNFVKTVYGEASLEENLKFIADALGNKGDTAREVIRNYFLKDFYADHLKIYQKRPIYWLFDSGKQNGFKALIYMPRYDADTVGRVRTDYLHRAQKYVETAMQSAQYTIESTSSASDKSKATKAVAKYTKQLAEMRLYDEAIAHIANRRIEIDLDDGVKVNYAKFQGVEVAQEGKKTVKIDLLAKIL
jgi:hypothetical protein